MSQTFVVLTPCLSPCPSFHSLMEEKKKMTPHRLHLHREKEIVSNMPAGSVEDRQQAENRSGDSVAKGYYN